jgi:uridine phosphorylase
VLIKKEYPILEFDSTKAAFINPQAKSIDMPEKCVICFFKEVIDGLYKEGRTKIITEVKSECGLHPIYEFNYKGERMALFHPMVGSPMAAGLLENVIALGATKFIACGGAGVLDEKIRLGHIVIPHSAIRDEGTSYHYLPPSREVEASPEGIKAIQKTLNSHNIDYVVSKTWTTDAIYRETPEKIKLRKSEGCVTVEMECAAFFAVAKFRGVIFAQLLYGGDDLSSEQWDSRDWNNQTSVREKLFWLATESCTNL